MVYVRLAAGLALLMALSGAQAWSQTTQPAGGKATASQPSQAVDPSEVLNMLEMQRLSTQQASPNLQMEEMLACMNAGLRYPCHNK